MKISDISKADNWDIAVELCGLIVLSERLRGRSIENNKNDFYRRRSIEKKITMLVTELCVRGWIVEIRGEWLNFKKRKGVNSYKQTTL